MAQRLSDPELSTLEPVVDSDETLLSHSTSEEVYISSSLALSIILQHTSSNYI